MPNGKEIFANKSSNGLDNVNADYVDVLHDLTVHGNTVLSGTSITGPITATNINVVNLTATNTTTTNLTVTDAEILNDLTTDGDQLIKGNLTVWGSTTDTGAVNVTDSINGYLNGEQVHNTNPGNAAAAAFKAYNDTNDQAFFGITSSGNTGVHGSKRTFVEGPGIDISTTGGASKTVRFTTNDVNRVEIGDTEMTSHVPITIPANPTTGSQVANKTYVDAAVSGLGAISSLTGDVTATGPGAAATTIEEIQGAPVTITSITTDQILSYNGTAIVNQDTNGSGDVVRTTNATLVTPNLGGATADTLAVNNLTPSLPVFSNGSNALISNTMTGTGSVVMSTTPTFNQTTGTAPFNVVSTTRVTNLNAATCGNADTVTTNANLTGPITSVGNATSVASQTGNGSTFVMNDTPTLVTPHLGTPIDGNLSNCSGTASNLTAGNVTNSSVDFAGTPFTTKGVVYATDLNTITNTVAGSSGQVLVADGTGTPSWSTNIGGQSGSTALSSVDFAGTPFTTGGVVTASDTNTITSTTSGTAGQVLVSNGTGVAPTFQYAGAALPDFGNFSSNTAVTFTVSPANATAGANYQATTTFSFYLSTDPGTTPLSGAVYASQDTYTFVSSSSHTVVIGSVYSNNGNQFIAVASATSTSLLFYGLGFAFPQSNGNLTLVTGSGDATIPFTSQSITTPGYNYIIDSYDTLTNILYAKSAYDPIYPVGILNKVTGVGSQTITYDGWTRPDSYYFTVQSTITGGTTLSTIGSGVPLDAGYLVKDSLGSGDDVITYSARTIVAVQLTSSSPTTIYSTVTKQFNLPDATTLQPGRSFIFVGPFNVVIGNNATVSIYNYGDSVYLIPLYSFPNTNDALFRATLLENTTSVGKWAFTYEASGSRGEVAYQRDLDAVEAATNSFKFLQDIYNALNDSATASQAGLIAGLTTAVGSLETQMNSASLLTNTVVVWNGTKMTSLDGTEDGSLLTYKSSPDAPQYGGKAVITDNTNTDVILGVANNYTSGDCDAIVAKAPLITGGASVSSYFGQGIGNGNCLRVKYTHYGNADTSNVAQMIMGDTELSLFANHIQMVNTGTESLRVENDSTSGTIDLAQFYMPNMSAADNVNFKMGKNTGNGNYTSTRFHYIANDSISNYAIWSIGLLDHTAITLNNTLNPSITMTGATTINNANSGFDSLTVVNSAVDTSIETAAFMNPNLPGGVANIKFGVNSSGNNHGDIKFTYGSSGSVANSLSTEMGFSKIEQFASGANTITGPTQINNITGTLDSLVVTNQETTSIDVEMASFMAPNINSGHVSTIRFGRNTSTNNYVSQGFQYAGNNSTSNAYYNLIGSSEYLMEASGVHTASGTAFNDFNGALTTGGTVNLKIGKNAGALNAANYGYVHQAGDNNGYNHALIGVNGYESLRVSALAGVSPNGSQVMGDFNTGALYTNIATNSTSKYTGGVIVKSRYTFTITAATCVLGDVYTNNGQFFYVIATSSGTTMVTSGINDPSGSVLTRVQGTGAASITFSTFTVSEGGLAVQGPVFANHINAANDDAGGTAPNVATFYARNLAINDTGTMRFGKGTAGDDYTEFRYYVDSVTNSIMSIVNGNSAIGFGRTSGSFLSSIPSSGLTAFTVNNSIAAAENIHVLDTFAPSLQVGFNNTKQFGKDVSTGNKVSEDFFYNGNNNTGNYYRIYMDNGAELYLNNTTIPQVAALGQFSITNSTQTTPTLKAHNVNASAGTIEVGEFMADNVNNGNFVDLKFGKNTSTGNYGAVQFFSNGNNDAANRFTFGLGSAGLAVNNAGENALAGKTTVTASGTSALVVNNNATGVVDVGEFYQPNMVASDAASVIVGKNSTSGNNAQLSFTYNADSTNHAALTCGSGDFTISSGGLSVLTASTLSTTAVINQVTANLGTGTHTLASFFNAGSVPVSNQMQIGYNTTTNACLELLHYADNVDAANDYATLGLITKTPAIQINPTSLKFQQPVDFPNSTYTTNGVAYASSATRLASTGAGTNGQVLTAVTGGAPVWSTPSGGGTVTSVAMTVPSILQVSGTPITTSGTLAVTTTNTPTGSGAIVLATSPSIVTPAITTTATTTNTPVTVYAASLSTSNQVSANVGVNSSALNNANYGFFYVGNGSGSNYALLGINGYESLQLFPKTGVAVTGGKLTGDFEVTGKITCGNLAPTQQIISAGTTTYTTPANVKYIIITCVGAGGGGASSAAINSLASNAASGGGGGAMAKHMISSPAAQYSCSVGTGGSGGAGGLIVGTAASSYQSGAAGGDTFFYPFGGGTSLCYAKGGSGGNKNGDGGAGGSNTSAAGNRGYYFGGCGMSAQITGGTVPSGSGGNSALGGGGGPGVFGSGNTANAAGNNGTGYGGGGGGAFTFQNQTSPAGGNGANGIIIVDEYYI